MHFARHILTVALTFLSSVFRIFRSCVQSASRNIKTSSAISKYGYETKFSRFYNENLPRRTQRRHVHLSLHREVNVMFIGKRSSFRLYGETPVNPGDLKWIVLTNVLRCVSIVSILLNDFNPRARTGLFTGIASDTEPHVEI